MAYAINQQVRNYATPDPKRVVANITGVLATGNMDILEKGSYQFLITHCGFIAHFDHAGFIATYRDDLPAFVEQFLSQHGMGWETRLDHTGSYFYDTSYQGKILADIIRELVPIFQAYEPGLKAAHVLHKNMEAEARLRALAKELGYDLVKRTPAGEKAA